MTSLFQSVDVRHPNRTPTVWYTVYAWNLSIGDWLTTFGVRYLVLALTSGYRRWILFVLQKKKQFFNLRLQTSYHWGDTSKSWENADRNSTALQLRLTIYDGRTKEAHFLSSNSEMGNHILHYLFHFSKVPFEFSLIEWWCFRHIQRWQTGTHLLRQVDNNKATFYQMGLYLSLVGELIA